MKQHFSKQFSNINTEKLARRQRFMRHLHRKLHYKAAVERYKERAHLKYRYNQ